MTHSGRAKSTTAVLRTSTILPMGRCVSPVLLERRCGTLADPAGRPLSLAIFVSTRNGVGQIVALDLLPAILGFELASSPLRILVSDAFMITRFRTMAVQ
jgi:hypothetical protein